MGRNRIRTSTGRKGPSGGFFSNDSEYFAGDVEVETPEEAYDPKLHELLSRAFKTHHIPMDVFQGTRIRPGPVRGGY